jgi:predicted sulfurtransferase
MKTLNISNITGYKFTPITNTKSLQEEILKHSKRLGLKGTVLISQKGLNFSLHFYDLIKDSAILISRPHITNISHLEKC